MNPNVNIHQNVSPIISHKKLILICIFLGFSSGLPIYALATTVSVWLKSYGVSLKAIGLMTLIMFPYAWKFIWAPLLDRFEFPIIGKMLGKRRAWLILTQISCLILIASLGYSNINNLVWSVAPLCFMLAFCSASQDIIADAYRREIFSDDQQAPAMAVWLASYKVSSIISSLGLVMADGLFFSKWITNLASLFNNTTYFNILDSISNTLKAIDGIYTWQQIWWITALFMLFGIFTTLFIPEPQHSYKIPSLRLAIVEPFTEFFSRLGIKHVVLILSFICLYKLGDMMATRLASVFYIELGYSKTEVGLAAKNVGLISSIVGGIVGAIWMNRLGTYRSLWVFGIFQALAIFGFIWISYTPEKNLLSLSIIIAIEAMAVGMGSAALGAYLATLTNRKYSATQFALFTSIAALPGTILGGYIGYLRDMLGGWHNFFIFCAFLAIPGLVILFFIGKSKKSSSANIN
jgi:MFS transporter, PAT family, beta-lactamase induction signal transducer AmpG